MQKATGRRGAVNARWPPLRRALWGKAVDAAPSRIKDG